MDNLDKIGSHPVTLDALEAFAKRIDRRRAKEIIATMSRRQPFIEAVRTQLGRELLADLVVRQADIIEKVYEGTATSDETNMLKAYKNIQEMWETKISNFLNVLNEINAVSTNGSN